MIETWITDWSEIGDEQTYIVCSINRSQEKGTFYLAKPEIAAGWQVKRLLKNCYAAVPMPQFDGRNLSTQQV